MPILLNLHAVSMTCRSKSFTIRQVLSIVINNGKWFKMYFVSISHAIEIKLLH